VVQDQEGHPRHHGKSYPIAEQHQILEARVVVQEVSQLYHRVGQKLVCHSKQGSQGFGGRCLRYYQDPQIFVEMGAYKLYSQKAHYSCIATNHQSVKCSETFTATQKTQGWL
jgi:hypothetical protein